MTYSKTSASRVRWQVGLKLVCVVVLGVRV